MNKWRIPDYHRAMRALALGRKCFPGGTWYVTNEYRDWHVVCSNWSSI